MATSEYINAAVRLTERIELYFIIIALARPLLIMFATKSISLLGLLGLVTGAAVPNNDGFPMPNKDQQVTLAKQAGGKLPNVALPKKLGPGSTTAFQLIAFNELFETAYFDSLLQNITNGVQGYEADNKEELIKIFSTVRAVRGHISYTS